MGTKKKSQSLSTTDSQHSSHLRSAEYLTDVSVIKEYEKALNEPVARKFSDGAFASVYRNLATVVRGILVLIIALTIVVFIFKAMNYSMNSNLY